MTSEEIIECEVCALPHRRGVGICEACGHALGRAPDWPAIRGQRSSYGRSFLIALGLVVAMLALNLFLFGGIGFILYLPPITWMIHSGYRYRVLSERLRQKGL